MKHLIMSLIVTASLLSACGLSKKQASVEGPDKGQQGKPGSSDKTQFEVPPLFAESQLKVDQWIEWQRTYSTGAKDCVRWKVANITSSGILIEGRISKKCVEPDDSRVESIFFQPDSGQVLEHQIKTVGMPSTTQGPLYGKSIFGYIYGNPNKVQFLPTAFKFGENQFAVYKIGDTSFYNNAGHAFHAFALSFIGTDNPGTRYQFKQSEPALEALPKDSKD